MCLLSFSFLYPYVYVSRTCCWSLLTTELFDWLVSTITPPLSLSFSRASMKGVCSQESSPLGFLTWETTLELWRAGCPCRTTTAPCCTASLICTPSPSLRTQSYYRTTSWTWQPACWPVALTPHALSFSNSLWSVTHSSLWHLFFLVVLLFLKKINSTDVRTCGINHLRSASRVSCLFSWLIYI